MSPKEGPGEKWKRHLVIILSLVAYASALPMLIEDPIIVDNELLNINPVLSDDKDNNNTSIVSILSENKRNSSLLRNEPVRPEQTISSYSVEITLNGDTFAGRLIIQVILTGGTQEDPIRLHASDLNIQSISYGIATLANPQPCDFFYDEWEGILEIFPPVIASSYFFLIEYTGTISNTGQGLYRGEYNDDSYVAMNLYPTHARRVFPCMDEPNLSAPITWTINSPFQTIVTNAVNEGNPATALFTPLLISPHLWGMVAHQLQNINIPGDRIRMYGRTGLSSVQQSFGSIMSQSLMTFFNEYTTKPYFEIDVNAEELLHIFALPDITKTWKSLRMIAVWEPYILMEDSHSMLQQKLATVHMAEAFANQWFGYVIHPENWKHSWVISGLGRHAAYEAASEVDFDLDMNTIFVTDVIQESLLRDAYSVTTALEPSDDLYDEAIVRNYINGLMNYKAPAVLHTLQLILGENSIRSAGRILLNSRSLQDVNSQLFADCLNSDLMLNGNQFIGDVGEVLDDWMFNTGYPVVNINTRVAGVIVTQEKFAFTNTNQQNYGIPLSYTTKGVANFDNIYPSNYLDTGSLSITVFLDEEDWILFNIQGQGYYRVNYDENLWERIIWALEDPDERPRIHPLNRATLVDDALNLARAGQLDYEIAFQVVLTMNLETEYAVWKAFIRNMNFIKKHLEAFISDDDDGEFDPDIYLRMVRRTIESIENELSFYPDPLLVESPMRSLTRGLVMDHACRAGYRPCIAAAVDWFYDPNSQDVAVNPDIPKDLRPAVYCAMAREGGDEILNALWARYDEESVHYERVVILESLACSQDPAVITSLLQETVAQNARFGIEERSKIFKAVAESSYQNANLALNFLTINTFGIKQWYGGPDKLEEVIFVMSENIADGDMLGTFETWIYSINSNLDDSYDAAERALLHATEDMIWNTALLDYVYEWIDENNASGLSVSITLLTFFAVIGMALN